MRTANLHLIVWHQSYIRTRRAHQDTGSPICSLRAKSCIYGIMAALPVYSHPTYVL